MKFIFIDNNLPMPDRASADLRMFTIVRLLSKQGHDCHYFVLDASAFKKKYSQVNFSRYKSDLETAGVRVHIKNLDKTLLDHQFDMIYFKYFYPAEKRIDKFRLLQPKAKIVIDSVDLVYARLFAKAELEKNDLFFDEATQTKQRELATYKKADLTITITAEDTDTLLRDESSINTFIIPNIHEIYNKEETKTENPSLVFIGIFSHDPNVDAVLYFHQEIWPQLLAKHPDIHWYIVGGNAPPEINQLSDDSITVTGYVPETLPYLKKCWISIAPLRFGAGMKGKVGEAMAAGIPVVTTEFGAQGLAVTNEKELIIYTSTNDCIKQISDLLLDNSARLKIGRQGLDFIDSNYSPNKVSNILQEFSKLITHIPGTSRPFISQPYRLFKKIDLFINSHILWRFRK
ncbi:MAG: glycosyltransferase [Porticoccaceae bacterium]|nr:glycosyltransferase [Porticoccaceae bacterium]